jgi:hypothetical protein
MYAILIVLHITLPNQERHKFNIYPPDRFVDALCASKAKQWGDYFSDYTKRKIRFSSIKVEATCQPNPTLGI